MMKKSVDVPADIPAIGAPEPAGGCAGGCGLSGCADCEEKEDRAKPQSAAEDCAGGHFVGSWIEAV
jgi:hypothetical protein